MPEFLARLFHRTQTLDLETGTYNPAPGTDKARRRIGYTLLGLLIVIVLLGFFVLYVIELRAYSLNQNVIAKIITETDAKRAADTLNILNITAAESKASADRLATLLNIVFGPVVTLLGSVTGFYFGTHSVQNSTVSAVPAGASPLNLDQPNTGAPSGGTPIGDAAGSGASGVGSG